MQVQVNTDNTVEGREELAFRVESEIRAALGRFEPQITRLEIHLGDENGLKQRAADKRCTIEARLEGRRPEAVAHQADTLREAWTGAARKLSRLLDSTLGRLSDHKGEVTIRKEVRA